MTNRWWKMTVFLLLITFKVARSDEKKFASSWNNHNNSPSCSTRGPRMQCGGPRSNENRNECVKNPRCCWSPGSNQPNCYVNMGAGNMQAELERVISVLGNPPSRHISNQPLRFAAKNLNVSASERMELEKQAGMYNMQSAAFTMNFGFPTCPLNVPFCQRVRCQPDNLLSESNPNECYKDPRCCFDADLFLHKYILGSSFLGDAPVCFMGPTANRFTEITSMIQPWNPFYLQPVMDIFGRYLDLEMDFHQTSQCFSSNMFDMNMTPKCGWEGITKLECNLKGCCYNSKTGRCAYPSHLFQQNGKGFMKIDMQQFPELFETKTTQCMKDGLTVDHFELFKRLPCAHSSVSTGSMSSDFLNPYNTCPSICCNNRMAMNDLSNSGPQSRYGQSNSPYPNYLSNPLMSQADVNFYCPYYYVKFPGLGDLTHSVRGCCKQTACYHKSLRSFAQLSTASWSDWSAWTSCNALCGQQGEKSRERRCLMYGTNTQQANTMCGSGLSYQSTTCYGDCGSNSYGWTQWGQWSDNCEGPCGGQGVQRRYRTCQAGGSCQGSSVESVSCQAMACSCEWSAWMPDGPCSVTYGTGSVRSYSRQCLSQGMPCHHNQCGGSAKKTTACDDSFGLGTRYARGEWSEWSRCSSNCEHTRYKLCKDTESGVVVSHQNCLSTGRNRETENCRNGECVPDQSWVSWGSWSQWTDCSDGGQVRTRYRHCLYMGRASDLIGDSICTFVFNTSPIEEQPCYYRPQIRTGSSSSYSWSNWSYWSMCSKSCGSGQQSRTRFCMNNHTKQRTSITTLCGSSLSTMQTKNCHSGSMWCRFGFSA